MSSKIVNFLLILSVPSFQLSNFTFQFCRFTKPALQIIHEVLESRVVERVQNLNLCCTTRMHTNTRRSILESSSKVAFTWYSKADILHTVGLMEGYCLEFFKILKIFEVYESKERARRHNSYGVC